MNVFARDTTGDPEGLERSRKSDEVSDEMEGGSATEGMMAARLGRTLANTRLSVPRMVLWEARQR